MKRIMIVIATITLIAWPRPTSAQGGAVLSAACPNLPSGFNPATASDDALHKFGFPARPQRSEGLASWLYAMKNARHCIAAHFTNDSQFALENSPSITRWAGYHVNASSNGMQGFYYASAYWTVPYRQTNAPSGSYHVASSWLGFGGTNGSNNVVQAGTVSLSDADLNTGKYYEVFIEDYSGSDPNSAPAYKSFFTISPGDQMYVTIDQRGTSNTQATVYFENVTRQTFSPAVPLTITYPASNTVDYEVEEKDQQYYNFGN